MPLNLQKSTCDWLVCQCGNEPHKEGFYTCLTSGRIIEPVIGGDWDGTLYLCASCFAIYNIDLMEQVGIAHPSAISWNSQNNLL